MILSYQTAGEFVRWNPHFHGLLLEGGFDSEGNFVYFPISNTNKMTELFRKLVIKLFTEKKLINEDFARNLLSWKHSGFSIDNSVRILSFSQKTKEALVQYIARCPISLKKITYEPFHGRVLFKSPKYSEYFKENFKVFDAVDFIALVTAHIPPKNKQYIRRYGLYSSRTRGIWIRSEHIQKLAPKGWSDGLKEEHNIEPETENDEVVPEAQECTASSKQQASTWARLIKKVYGVEFMVCPKCNSQMKIIVVIIDPEETAKILKHLLKIGRAPPNFDPALLN